METLLRSVLFQDRLCRVDTPQLVARYNECLRALGLPVTQLTKFHIDGLGWSPEVAEERGNRGYLSGGSANSVAIILTPNQQGRPVYWPLNSYDLPAVSTFFEKFSPEVADITTTSGLALEIDRELSFYKSPKDLLLVDYIIVRPEVSAHIEFAREQKELAERLLHEETAWRDRALREALMRGAAEHGDMRYRRVAVPDMRYADLLCFHSRAFGGVFVLRHSADDEYALIVVESSGHVDQYPGVLGLEKDLLLTRLRAHHFAQVDLSPSREVIERLEGYREELEKHAEVRDVMQGSSQKRGLPSAELFQEVEVALKQLGRGHRLEVQDLSPELLELLVVSSPKLGASDRGVVEMLLCRVCNRSVGDLYRYDQERFLRVYEGVSQPEQEWLMRTFMRREKQT